MKQLVTQKKWIGTVQADTMSKALHLAEQLFEIPPHDLVVERNFEQGVLEMRRNIRIQEINERVSSMNVSVEYSSDELPDWFKPLQYIVEDASFSIMTITLKDVHYLILPVREEEES